MLEIQTAKLITESLSSLRKGTLIRVTKTPAHPLFNIEENDLFAITENNMLADEPNFVCENKLENTKADSMIVLTPPDFIDYFEILF